MNRKKAANINELFKKPNNDNYDDGSEALCSQESLEASKKHLEDWCEEQIRRYGDKSVWGDYATEEMIKPELLNRIRSAQHKDIRTKDNATNYAWRVAMAKFAMHLADRYGIDLDNEWSLVNEELKKNRKMNMKVIKISESKFHNIVKKIVNESVNRILKESNINEYPYSPYKEGSPEDNEWSQKTFTNNTSRYWKAKHPEWDDEKSKKAASIARGDALKSKDSGVSKENSKFAPGSQRHWKQRHPEWSDEKCQKAADRYSKHYGGNN